MITCPNINNHQFQALEKTVGTNQAYYLWNFYEGNVPISMFKDNVSDDYQIFYQTNPNKQTDIANSFISMNDSIKQVTVGDNVEYEVNGSLGYTRVTEFTKKLQRKNFSKASPRNEARWAIDRTQGTLIHKIASVAIAREFPQYNKHISNLTSQESSFNKANTVINSIDKGVEALILETKKEGGILLTEVKVADTKRKIAGTIDILRINKDGSVDIFDFKTLAKLELANTKGNEWNLQLSEYKNILESSDNVSGKTFEVKHQRILPVVRGLNTKYNEVTEKLMGIMEKKSIDSPSDKDLVEYLDDIYDSLERANFHFDENKTLTEIPIISELTGNKAIDDKIATLAQQIQYNEALIAKTKSIEDKEVLRSSNKAKRIFIQSLQLKKSFEDIVNAAKIDLTIMDKFLSSSKYNPDVSMDDYIGTAKFYSNIVELFTEEEFNSLDKEEKDDLFTIQGYANTLHGRLLKNVQERIIHEAQEKTNIIGLGAVKQTSDLFKPVKESGIWSSLVYGISSSQHPLLITLKKLVDRAFHKYREKSDILKEKLLASIKELKAISSGDIWEPFLQRNEKGELTGNLVDRMKAIFWEDRKKAIDNKDKEWMLANTVVNRELYNNKREGYKKFLEEHVIPTKVAEFEAKSKDKISKKELEIQAASIKSHTYIQMMNDWEAANGTEENPNIFIFNSPKETTKYVDPKYDIIKNNPVYNKFYQLYTTTIEELNTVIPYDHRVRKSFIPNFQAGLLEMASKVGIQEATKNNFFQWDNIAVDNDFNKSKITALTGEQLKFIPISGISSLRDDNGKLLNADNKKYDLALVLQMFADSVYKYQELSEIQSVSKMINMMVREQHPQKYDAKGNPVRTTKKISRDSELSEDYINRIFYNMNQDKDGLQFKVEPNVVTKAFGIVKKDSKGEYQPRIISGVKIIDQILRFVAIKNLGLNLFSPAVNLGQGTTAGYMEGFAGRYYSPKDYIKAVRLLTTKDEKTVLLAKRLDIIQKEFTKDSYKELTTSTTEKVLNSDNAFALQEFGENIAQNAVLISCLLSGKFGIKMDDFDVIDGKLVAKRELSDDQLTVFKAKVRKVNASLIGNYDPQDPMLAKTYVAGRALLQHRTWLPAMWKARWGAEEYDYILEKEIIGRYKLIFRKTGRQFLKAYAKTGFLGSKNKDIVDKFDAETIAGMKANLAEAAIMLVLFILGHAVLDDDDPKDDSGAQRYAKRTTTRLLTEMTFFFNVGSMLDILISPVPAMGLLEDGTSLVRHLNNSGWWQDTEVRDKATPGKYARRFVPAVGQLERFYNQIILLEDRGYYQ